MRNQDLGGGMTLNKGHDRTSLAKSFDDKARILKLQDDGVKVDGLAGDIDQEIANVSKEGPTRRTKE